MNKFSDSTTAHGGNASPVTTPRQGEAQAVVLKPLAPVALLNSRYTVVVDGKVGTISKDHDSFMTKFPWRCWAGHGALGTYLGEFDTWQEAAEALRNFRKTS